jgi:outer membrane protein OmpA-like peptidoglycan-associated protein
MKNSGQLLLCTIALPITFSLVLATSGCATKSYARHQAAVVNQRVSKVEKKTNEEVAYLTNKHETDISQVNERISTTDMKLGEVANSAQQANSTATQAAEAADANKTQISANSTQISSLATGVANALNYQLVEKGDVMFGFNKSELTTQGKAALDSIIQKVQALPRAEVELVGFTDPIGSEAYNLALSRRRAEAVQRYMVQQKVSPYTIHIVGLGEASAPEHLAADLRAANPNSSQKEINKLSRRVVVRVYGAGSITEGTASRSDQ